MSVATFQNLGFESAGSTPGAALGWQLQFQSSAEEIAAYSPAPEKPQETFEKAWIFNEDFLFQFAPTSVEPTLYDSSPESVEDFESEWEQNEFFLFEHSGLDAADYNPGVAVKLLEDFDGFWATNESFLYSFGPGSFAASLVDSLEFGWRNNQSFLFSFAPANLIAASFDNAGVAELVEDYDELWPTIRMVTV